MSPAITTPSRTTHLDLNARPTFVWSSDWQEKIGEKAAEARRAVDIQQDLHKRGGGGTYTGPYGTSPPSSTDTRSHKIKIPTVGGTEGGFWGLISGLAVATLAASLLLFFCLRRRKRNRLNNQSSSSSSTSRNAPSHNSFTSLTSLFRPFSRRSAPQADNTSTSSERRGWMHGSNNDWSELADDEEDLVGAQPMASPGLQSDAKGNFFPMTGGGGHRPIESIQLHNAIRESNPDPEGRDRRRSRSPRPSPRGSERGGGGGNHPYESGYGQGGASSSTLNLGREDEGPPVFEEYRGADVEGPFSDSAAMREGEGERPISGRFREGN